MSRVMHFEIHAENPERAIKFYSHAFGWTFTKWDGPMPYWVIVTGPDGSPGIDGGLMPRQGEAPKPGQPVNAHVCTVAVGDIDHTTRLILEGGGVTALPRMPVPGVGWLAYFTDTEGNIFGVLQPDTGAKQRDHSRSACRGRTARDPARGGAGFSGYLAAASRRDRRG